MKVILLLFLILFLTSLSNAQWVRQNVDTTASLRGLSVVNEKVIWASGTKGTVIRTTDGGGTWKVFSVPGADKLDFRDIEAFDAATAYILSIGNGDTSRIYKTEKSGETWKLQFQNDNKDAFFDAIACWDRTNCIAMSDPVDGHYLLISTANGGDKWERIYSNELPAAIDGEAAFAASGSCIITFAKTHVFLVTGGKAARVFRSTDRGKSWNGARTPIASGTSGSGIFSIAMRDATSGVIVGGNYEQPAESRSTLAFTSDGGATWSAGKGMSGYRSGVTYVNANMIVAVGTNGSDISADGGRSWTRIDDANYNSVQAKGRSAVWAVGPAGYVARLR